MSAAPSHPRTVAEPGDTPPADAGVHPPPSMALDEVAEMVHHATDGQTDLVVVAAANGATVDVGFWPIDDHVDHPTDALIGWQPPAWAHSVGLVTSGVAHSDAGTEPVRVTVLMDRSARAATVIERGDRPAETLTEPPQGWGADALLRCLGLATPPPDVGLAACVESTWLTAVAEAVWRTTAEVPSSALTWEQVALLHPLHPPGPAVGASALAAATTMLEAESSWPRLLELFTRETTEVPRGPYPPGGHTVALHRWFDPGSFSRWSVRRRPDVEHLLFEVLDELGDPVGMDLLDALVSIT